jgi:tetratricopeptide (TPR) repeat protein
VDLLQRALEKDPGFSRAHLLLGVHSFATSRFEESAGHLKQAIERDPYLDEAYYYLAMAQFELGDVKAAERNLYYVWPGSAYYPNREYHLGRQAYMHGDIDSAVKHLEQAVKTNGYYLSARVLLAMIDREKGRREGALERLAEIETIDPTSPWAAAERYLLTRDASAKTELERLLGGQSQEAIEVSLFYRKLARWKEALEILRLVEANNKDVWGTPAEFYYTLADCARRAGEDAASEEHLRKARAAVRNIDRFPYREESEVVLQEAAARDPGDWAALYLLGCLQYNLGKTKEAIRNWESAAASKPGEFSIRRVLGMAYAEQGFEASRAAEQLEKAVELNPAHIRTMNDLSSLYARTGRFDEQVALLKRALERSPGDDDLVEGLITTNLIMGRYDEAERLITTHRFQPRHRTYHLRDRYRFLHYGLAGVAYNRGDYEEALRQFRTVLSPPVSLGVDDFQFESTPRLHYGIGRTLEAMGRTAEAREAYEKSIYGLEQLTGDWDSLNVESFHMALSLEKIGRPEDARRLLERLETFAQRQLNAPRVGQRAQSRYLLALLRKREGRPDEARRLVEEALRLEPDSLAPRLEMRGDVIDPLSAAP